MAWLPNMTQPPKVYFRVVVQPAQSVSVYVSSCCVLLAELAHQTWASIPKHSQSLKVPSIPEPTASTSTCKPPRMLIDSRGGQLPSSSRVQQHP